MRVAFALDCHDRDVIGWVATTAGISGEMIRNLMVECVETRFHAPRAPHPVQWLAGNGSVYAAAKTLDIAVALNIEHCFTPVESPRSNDVAEAFVKTFKRDYVRVNPLPDAAATIAAIASWMSLSRRMSAAGTTTSSARTALWPPSVVNRLHRKTRLGESP